MKFSARGRGVAANVARLMAVVAAVMFVGTVVQALPAGTPPAGSIVLNPPTGNSATSIAMNFAQPPQFCPGDAVASFRWTTFLVPRSVDLATLTYSPSGNPLGPAFSSALRTAVPGGVLVRAQNPGLGDGIVVPPLAVDFANIGFSTVTPGQYWIGIACTKSDGVVVQTEKYWSAPITITAAAGAGPNNFTYAIDGSTATTTTVPGSTTTTTVGGSTTSTTVAGSSTTVAGSSTTTTSTSVAGSSTTSSTTVAGSSTTSSTVAGGTTTTSVAGATTTVPGSTATVTPVAPTPGGRYQVSYPNCQVGETITFSQPQSTPATVTDTCKAASALASGDAPSGFRRPQQLTTGTATGSFTAAPTTPGTYTVTMTGTVSAQRTTTFVVAAAATPVTTAPATGGSPSGTTVATPGTLPSTGSSTTAIIVWGVLLLVFGRMAILLGRKPKVIAGVG